MKRNVDKIKELERELGRYRKKVEDDAKFQENLRARLELAMRGNQETNQLVDAILTQAAITYGVDAVDPDDATVVLGKRLELPMFDAQELRKTWEVKARRDTESGKYIIGIMRREPEAKNGAPDGACAGGERTSPGAHEHLPEADAKLRRERGRHGEE